MMMIQWLKNHVGLLCGLQWLDAGVIEIKASGL
jgi:hypothetical protein